ncbi:VOC family protein [Nitrospira sp. Kam-Ns4a]
MALRVTDLTKSRQFYEGLFGLQVVWQPDPEHLYLGSGSDNLALHQIPAEALTDYPGQHGQFLDHLGFVVESEAVVDRLYEQATRQGIAIVQAPRRHRDGSYSCYLADPDGNTVQVLFEPTISRER